MFHVNKAVFTLGDARAFVILTSASNLTLTPNGGIFDVSPKNDCESPHNTLTWLVVFEGRKSPPPPGFLCLTQGSYLQIALGVVELLVTFGPLAVQAPLLVGAIAKEVTKLLSGERSRNTGQDIQALIDRVEQLRDQDRKEKGEGVGQEFQEWWLHLNAFDEKEGATPEAINNLMTMSNPGLGSSFLGSLLTYITQEKAKRKTVESAQALLEICTLYCALSGMREYCLYETLCVVSNSQGAEKIKPTIKALEGKLKRQKEISEALKFLHRPNKDDILVASVYTPGEYPVIAQYLKYLGVPDLPRPDPLSQELRVKKWPGHFLEISGLNNVTTTKNAKPDQKTKYKFNEEEPGSGVWTIAFEHNFLPLATYGNRHPPSWRLILTDDDEVFIAARTHPERFL